MENVNTEEKDELSIEEIIERIEKWCTWAEQQLKQKASNKV